MNRLLQMNDVRANESSGLASTIDLVNILWRRRGIILASFIGIGILGALYYFFIPREYQARADVLLVPKHPEVVTGDAQYVTGFSEIVATHRALIVSPLIVTRAVELADLHQLETFAEYDEDWDLSGIIIENLIVSGGPRDLGESADSIITLTYQGPVEPECSIIVSAVLASYMNFLDEIHQDMSEDTMQLISEARELLENDLQQQEEAYVKFRERSPLVTQGADEVNPLQNRLEAIETQRTELLLQQASVEGKLKAIRQARRKELQDEQLLALVTELRDSEATDATTTNVSTALDNQILQLADREKELMEHYGPNHPRVATIRKRIESARRLLAVPSTAYAQRSGTTEQDEPTDAELVNLYVQSLEQELDRLNTSEQLLTDLYQTEHEVAKELSGYLMKDDSFRRNIDRTQQLYDGIVNQLQEASLVKDYGGFEARVIAEPTWAEQVVPSLLVTGAGILLGGGCLGFMLAFFVEMRDKGIHSQEELQAKLDVPVVGEIPNFSPSRNGSVTTQSDARSTLDPTLCVVFQPRSPQSEAIRSLRTSLMIGRAASESHLIQVTSPSPGDGKSTVTANLAASFTQLGKRVLVIDADLHQPRQHELFGVDATHGITSIVSKGKSMAQVVQATSLENLWVLPAGPVTFDMTELFSSQAFAALLEQARLQYDYVLIDSEPLLAVTDPCVIAARVDSVLLAVKPNKDSRDRAVRAKQVLAAVGITPTGVVVTRIGGPGARRYSYDRPVYYSSNVKGTRDMKQADESNQETT